MVQEKMLVPCAGLHMAGLCEQWAVLVSCLLLSSVMCTYHLNFDKTKR